MSETKFQTCELLPHKFNRTDIRPRIWISPTKYFTVSLLLVLAVQNRSNQVDGQCSRSTFAVTFLCEVVSYVEGKIWIRHVWVCFIQFCNTSFYFLPLLWIWRSILPSPASKVQNKFLLGCQSHNSLCFPSAVHHFCLGWVQPLEMDESLLESPYFPNSCHVNAAGFILDKVVIYPTPNQRTQ